MPRFLLLSLVNSQYKDLSVLVSVHFAVFCQIYLHTTAFDCIEYLSAIDMFLVTALDINVDVWFDSY